MPDSRHVAAYIERQADGKEEDQTVLEELNAYADARPSLIELLADDLTMLLTDISVHENALLDVQDLYFDSNPILFRDVEKELVDTIKAHERRRRNI